MTEPDPHLQWDPVRQRAPRVDTSRIESLLATLIVVVIGVALIQPWYAHWVDNLLLSRELAQVNSAFAADTARLTREMRAESARSERARLAREQAARLQRVEVKGVLDGTPPTVVVALGTADLGEASVLICKQAQAQLGRRLDDATLRVQRHRGASPAVTIGTIRC